MKAVSNNTWGGFSFHHHRGEADEHHLNRSKACVEDLADLFNKFPFGNGVLWTG